MKIQPVLFHRTDNLISKGIRLFTNSHWNHCGFIVEIEHERYFIEAVERGVIMMPINKMIKKYGKNCYIRYLPTVESLVNPLMFLDCQYQFSVFGTQIMHSFAKWLFGSNSYIANKISNKKEPNKFYCFELLAFVLGLDYSWEADGKTFSNLEYNG